MRTDPALIEAEGLLRAVQDQPAEVAQQADRLIANPTVQGEARIVAAYALGRAHHEQGSIADACRILANAASAAHDAGLAGREGHIRGSLALSLFTHGDNEPAWQQIDRAEALLTGPEQARMTMQRAIMAVHEGNLESGLSAFNRALPVLREAGDDLAVARLLISRGVAYSLRGSNQEAESDYQAGSEIARRIGQTTLAASGQANMAFSLGRRGDIPASLRWFDEARSGYAAGGDPGRYIAALETDLCDVLLLAGLNEEACDAAERALELAVGGENRVQEAEANLLLARALLARRRLPVAAERAAEAAALFNDAGRSSWAAQARYIEFLARQDELDPGDLPALRTIASQLEEAGWDHESLQVRTMIGMTEVRRGNDQDGLRELDRAAALRRRGTAPERANSWYATALARRATGDRRGARLAVNAGLRIVDEHRAVLGATELRVLASNRRRALTELGLELAVESGRLVDIVNWTERGREGALSLPPVLPPRDPELAAHIADYRRLSTQHVEAIATRGEAPPDADLLAAERRVAEAMRRLDGSGGARTQAIELRALRRRLGDRTLLQFHEVGGRVGVVALGETWTKRGVLASTAAVRDRVDSLFFGLRRLTGRLGTPAGLTAAAAATLDDAAWLQQNLIDPVVRDDDADIVIVPSDALADMAWNCCPIAAERPITVAPSLHFWAREQQTRPTKGTLAVAGPDVAGARAELEQIANLMPDTTVLTGADAKVDAVAELMSQVRLAHIAAHGTFRGDSPLFSSLAMADGALTIFDIERLAGAPECVILSACHAARGDFGLAGEVMGTSHAFVRMGADAVVAPLIAVADTVSAELMVNVHQAIVGGRTPSQALRQVIAATTGDDDLAFWTIRSFMVVGCDDRPTP